MRERRFIERLQNLGALAFCNEEILNEGNMQKQTTKAEKTMRRITMPTEVDLSAYNWLDLAFINGHGSEVLYIQFRRERYGSAELSTNVIGPEGDVSSAITLFDLE